MEILREGAPFLVGMLVPPVVWLATRIRAVARFKTLALILACILVGASASLMNGELGHGLPESMMAIIVDTSLVYTGSQLAYRIAWKPLLASRRRAVAASEALAQQRAQ